MLNEKNDSATQNGLAVDVYVAKIPDKVVLKPLYPAERTQEIETCQNERVKKQKYCVWKLLAYALRQSYGIQLEDLSLKKEKNGKWTAEGYFFSLSHCDDVAVVAVSRKKVGVDVEKISDKMKKLQEKFLTEKELCVLASQENKGFYLAEKWTQKESIFKMLSRTVFSPKTIQTSEYNTHTAFLKEMGNYILSVAIEDDSAMKMRTHFVHLW